jgi:hypothetical protein
MRQTRFALVLATAVLLGVGLVGWAQDASTAGPETPPATTRVDPSVFEERGARYDALTSSLQNVSDAFENIRSLAHTCLVVPNSMARASTIQWIILDLEGPSPAEAASMVLSSGYLLGEGGNLAQFKKALDAYVAFLEPYSAIVAPYVEAKCHEEYGAEFCPPGSGGPAVDTMVDRLDRLAERITALAEVALDVALRINLRGDPDDVTNDLMSIYACAVTAASYGPMEVDPIGTYSHRYTEEMPSMLYDFLTQFERLDQYLVDAVAAALSSN